MIELTLVGPLLALLATLISKLKQAYPELPWTFVSDILSIDSA